ncbi:MAG: SufE family protein [Verrucomicrobiota bacterium]|nr:SufE family protein [Verrucomicrobiota bacterium]
MYNQSTNESLCQMEFFERNVEKIKKKFAHLSTEDRYKLLIDMGQKSLPYPEEKKRAEHRVAGCQSTLYLTASLQKGKISFLAASDSLISLGLAALLIEAYCEVSPETLLAAPPKFLQELGILQSLSLNRSQGLVSVYCHMQRLAKEALQKETN